jgi:hypothetical protein
MKIEYKYSLIGRFFVVSSYDNFMNWESISDDNYDLIENNLSFNDGDLTSFVSEKGFEYYLFFSMSSKIEVFIKNDNIYIMNGLFYNDSWDYSKSFEKIEILQDIDVKVEMDNTLCIFNPYNKEDSYLIQVKKGIYSAHKTIFSIQIDNEIIQLYGVTLSYNKATIN